ncbi:hypothetical protein ZIOFF_061806 [Zingiber officinale]|uniref:Uncharacterized protein n=1 Tax=Zingiber officinale TaxID=94328 RepID=A0A8J5KEV8_ZINOF|nr:hypothetical protein ZIOFF_061806 [Zingiber officinale]
MASQTHNWSLFLLCMITLQCYQIFSTVATPDAKLYIVYMGERKHDNPEDVTASHHDLLTSLFGRKEDALASLVYSYKHGFSGFAAMITEEQVEELAESPDIVSVEPSRNYELQTTRSWDFLELQYDHPTKLLERSNYGDGIIIGIVDTGIWPESKSFDDDGYGPIPTRWKGVCQVGEAFGPSNCSRKIIGARYYTAGIDADDVKEDFLSPRDFFGHGTYTASIAVGSVVPGASFHGLATGAARGGAPRARLAVYKVIWSSSEGPVATSAGVLAAIDDAIHDGVDVLSLSLGVPHEDSFGALHAVAKGVTVVYAGGNSGPTPKSIVNTAPWVITVAASTIDRSFPTVIRLGNNRTFIGQSIFYNRTYQSRNKFRPLHDGGSCTQESLNGTDISRSIVLCNSNNSISPVFSFIEALSNVLNAGGKGLIFAQFTTNILDITYQCTGVICVLVDFDVANRISNYAAAKRQVFSASISLYPGEGVLSPKVAWFSSRGPAVLFPGVLKVRNKLLKTKEFLLRRSTPRTVSNLALLMRTASNINAYGMPIQAESTPRKIADPFDLGGGQIDPNRASDPGLVYDIDPREYFEFFNCTAGRFSVCAQARDQQPVYNLNLPAISVPDLMTRKTVWRRVTNVGEVDAVYKALVESPPGVRVDVQPPVLVFNATAKVHDFKVTFKAAHKLQGDYVFGSLTWSDGGDHVVRIPIAARVVIQDFYADVA